MDDFTKPAEELSEEAIEYINLRIERLKLRTARDISTVLGRFLGIFVMVMAGMTALMAASFGCVLIIGEAIGSYAGGAFIMAGVIAAVVAVLFCFREKLFRNTFIRLFIKIFYDNEKLR